MSTVYEGEVLKHDMSRNAKGGTEMMRDRFMRVVKPEFLKDVAIHFSRPVKFHPKTNIFYAHDLPDHETLNLFTKQKMDKFVFVSAWQRDTFMMRSNEVASAFAKGDVSVIHNAIEESPNIVKQTSKIIFVYHTTPHRGLDAAANVFHHLRKIHGDLIEFHVFSSFNIYGWGERDAEYNQLFNDMKKEPGVFLHGTVSNSEIRKFLAENATVFLYPSTWLETSCIAAIEAVASGCFVISTNYGALPETIGALEHTILVDPGIGFEEKIFRTANVLIEEMKRGNVGMPIRHLHSNHTLQIYGIRWNSLLGNLTNE